MPTKAVPLEVIQAGYRTSLKGIGTRIMQMRRERQLSQVELAAKIDVGRGSIALWEAGNTIPDLAALCFLAEKLGVSVHWLCFGGHNPDGDEEREELPITLVQLHPDKEPTIAQVIHADKKFINLARSDYVNLLGTTVTQDLANTRFAKDDVIIYDSAGKDPSVGGNFIYKSGSRLMIGEFVPRIGDKITVKNDEASFDTTIAEIMPYVVGRIVTHIHKS